MPMEKWNPFREFLDFQTDLERAWRRAMRGEIRPPQGAWAPSLESYARGNDLVLKLDVPGIEPDKVEIAVKDHELMIRGERRREEKVEEENYFTEEFSYGAFERTLNLPEESQTDDIKAAYEHGVLEIVVPQGAVSKEARKVPIESRKD
jgi:HSP20 family protein